MKKLTLAVAVATAIGAGGAFAYDRESEPNVGFIVADTVHNGASDQTTVGLLAICDTQVYWSFHDVNSKLLVDDQFHMTKNEFRPFLWHTESTGDFTGEKGYLVFLNSNDDTDPSGGYNHDNVLDMRDTRCLIVQAGQLDTGLDDYATKYPKGLRHHDLCIDNYDGQNICGSDGSFDWDEGVDIDTITEDTIRRLRNGARADKNSPDRMFLRYSMNHVAGDGEGSEILLWSAGFFGPATLHTNMYAMDETPRSVTINFPNRELNFIDPEDIQGVPDTVPFRDGHIIFDVPDLSDTCPSSTPGCHGPYADNGEGDGWFSSTTIFSVGFRAKQSFQNGYISIDSNPLTGHRDIM